MSTTYRMEEAHKAFVPKFKPGDWVVAAPGAKNYFSGKRLVTHNAVKKEQEGAIPQIVAYLAGEDLGQVTWYPESDLQATPVENGIKIGDGLYASMGIHDVKDTQLYGDRGAVWKFNVGDSVHRKYYESHKVLTIKQQLLTVLGSPFYSLSDGTPASEGSIELMPEESKPTFKVGDIVYRKSTGYRTWKVVAISLNEYYLVIEDPGSYVPESDILPKNWVLLVRPRFYVGDKLITNFGTTVTAITTIFNPSQNRWNYVVEFGDGSYGLVEEDGLRKA